MSPSYQDCENSRFFRGLGLGVFLVILKGPKGESE